MIRTGNFTLLGLNQARTKFHCSSQDPQEDSPLIVLKGAWSWVHPLGYKVISAGIIHWIQCHPHIYKDRHELTLEIARQLSLCESLRKALHSQSQGMTSTKTRRFCFRSEGHQRFMKVSGGVQPASAFMRILCRVICNLSCRAVESCIMKMCGGTTIFGELSNIFAAILDEFLTVVILPSTREMLQVGSCV